MHAHHTHIRVWHTDRGPGILISKRGPTFEDQWYFCILTCINIKPRTVSFWGPCTCFWPVQRTPLTYVYCRITEDFSTRAEPSFAYWLSLCVCACSPVVYPTVMLTVFTSLHGMQTRSSDENSVCPSVCPYVCQTRALWQKGRKLCLHFLFRFLYHMKEHLS